MAEAPGTEPGHRSSGVEAVPEKELWLRIHVLVEAPVKELEMRTQMPAAAAAAAQATWLWVDIG